MELTFSQDTIVSFDPDREALFNSRVQQTKMAMLTERFKEANIKTGVERPSAPEVPPTSSFNPEWQSDVLPFTAVKKYAKVLRATKYREIWEMHTSEYWDRQMSEIEVLAKEKVSSEMLEEDKLSSKKPSAKTQDASGIIVG